MSGAESETIWTTESSLARIGAELEVTVSMESSEASDAVLPAVDNLLELVLLF